MLEVIGYRAYCIGYSLYVIEHRVSGIGYKL